MNIRKDIVNMMRRCKDPQKMVELKTARTQSIIRLRKEIKIAKSLVNEFNRDINLIKTEAKAQDMFMQKQAQIKRPPYRSRARER